MTKREASWSRHYQEPWAEDALNSTYPMPLRVAFLAFGRHRANGHAVFRQGEVANILGHFDGQGTWLPADRRTVHRAIRTAIGYGLLAEGSKALCLVVPSHRIAGGMGSADTPCKRHPETQRSRHLKAVR
jgi:hypothetical protein